MTEFVFLDKPIRISSSAHGDVQAAELLSEQVLIDKAETGVALLAELYHQGFDIVLFHEQQLAPAFFDLSTGFAGELLQKATNFRMKLAFIGDFSSKPGRSLNDFIRESNRYGRILFVGSAGEARERFDAKA